MTSKYTIRQDNPHSDIDGEFHQMHKEIFSINNHN